MEILDLVNLNLSLRGKPDNIEKIFESLNLSGGVDGRRDQAIGLSLRLPGYLRASG
jgi:hypothetical protein